MARARNKLTGGSGETREHGWFGHTTLVGGSGPNQLIGRAGHVRFKPTKSTTLSLPVYRKRQRTQPDLASADASSRADIL